MKETDLFPPLKEWLENVGYDVYSEVQSGQGGNRADIVAIQKPVITIVEMKVTLSLDLIGQAVRWKPYVNYVYVAVPYSRHRYSSDYPCQLLRQEGIGVLQVREDVRHGAAVSVLVNPKFHRRINNHMRDTLVEQHKDLPGGHAGGGYVTPYKLTIDRVKEYLGSWKVERAGGWATMAEILQHCETHYSSPKSSLAAAMKSFEAKHFETRIHERKLQFRLKGDVEQ
jgi:hypothetical protein